MHERKTMGLQKFTCRPSDEDMTRYVIEKYNDFTQQYEVIKGEIYSTLKAAQSRVHELLEKYRAENEDF